METPWSNPCTIQKGQWLTYLDKDTDVAFVSVTMAQHGNSQFCHSVSQPAQGHEQTSWRRFLLKSKHAGEGPCAKGQGWF